jgi:hypothetical protein
MNLQAFVFLILIAEEAFSFELEEAVFQGKCKKENLCSQLCYEVNEMKLEKFNRKWGEFVVKVFLFD